jgi:large-conductance mechanosensitive channel
MITNGSAQQRERRASTDEGCAEPSAARDEPRKTHDERTGYGPPHPLDGLMKHVRELVEYANFYVETRKDSFRASIRGLILKAVVGVIGAIVGVTVLIMATIYLMSGIAAGLGWLFGERWELGRFALAAILFVALGAGAFLVIKSMNRKARQRTIKKYEQRQQDQKSKFGHNVRQRAAEVRDTH